MDLVYSRGEAIEQQQSFSSRIARYNDQEIGRRGSSLARTVKKNSAPLRTRKLNGEWLKIRRLRILKGQRGFRDLEIPERSKIQRYEILKIRRFTESESPIIWRFCKLENLGTCEVREFQNFKTREFEETVSKLKEKNGNFGNSKWEKLHQRMILRKPKKKKKKK